MLNEQAKISDNQDPKLLANDITDKIEELKREVNYMINKIKYFRPKTTKKPATSETKANKTTTNEGGDDKKQKEDGEQQQQSENEGGEDQSKTNENEGGEGQSKFGENYFNENQDETTTTDKPGLYSF